MSKSKRGTRTEHKNKTCILLPVRRSHAALGHAPRYFDLIDGKPVIEQTLIRLARVSYSDLILLAVYGEADAAFDEKLLAVAQDVMQANSAIQIRLLTDPALTNDDLLGLLDQRKSARALAMNSWRGGISGLNCYDELLPAAPLVQLLNQIDPPEEIAKAVSEEVTAEIQKDAEKESEAADGKKEEVAHSWRYESLLLTGPDWPLVDPVLCDEILARHLEHPEEMQMVFTQTPPGLCGVAMYRGLLESLAENHSYIGQVMSYSPTKPQPDPIGREVCVQIPSKARRLGERLIYDTAAAAELMDRLVASEGLDTLDLAAITEWLEHDKQLENEIGSGHREVMLDQIGTATHTTGYKSAVLPQQVTLELTTARHAGGALTPQYHMKRKGQAQRLNHAMPLDDAKRIIDEIAQRDDTLLTLGGMGDPLLYPHLDEVVNYAKEKGIFSVALETDLISPDLLHETPQPENHDAGSQSEQDAFEAPLKADSEADHLEHVNNSINHPEEIHRDLDLMEKLVNWPVDTLLVRMNADRAATYALTMCEDDPKQSRDELLHEAGLRFKQLIGHMEYLVNARNRRFREWMLGMNRSIDVNGRVGLPWLIPTMIRSPWTYGDIETFFDRWMHYVGHAVLERMPDTGLFDESAIWAHYDHLTVHARDAADEDATELIRQLVSPASLPCSMSTGIANRAGRLLIQSDGGVPYCHHDYLGQTLVGHIGEDSIASLWRRQLEGPSDAEAACLCGACKVFYETSHPWWQMYPGMMEIKAQNAAVLAAS